MSHKTDWDHLLGQLPDDVHEKLVQEMHYALRRIQARGQRQADQVPDSVRGLAVGEWRSRYLAGASKGARRRATYERIRNNPTYRAIEDGIMRKRGLVPASDVQLPRLLAQRPADELSEAELCQAYRSTNPRYGSSVVDHIVQKAAKEAFDDTINVHDLRQGIVGSLRRTARSRDLATYAQALGSFDLRGISDEQGALELVRSTHLVRTLLAAEYGTAARGFLVSQIMLAKLWEHPDVAAMRAFARALFGKDPVESLLVRKVRRKAHSIEAYLRGEELARLVAGDLLRNPHYAAQVQAAVELRDRVRENVPQTPLDAYPLARTLRRSFVLHVGPTNSGKTHDAIAALAQALSGAYLGPLRLLAYEQFEEINRLGRPCSLVTGEEAVDVAGARHVSSTIEMADFHTPVDVAVIDEAQMIADPDRGHRWTAAILGMPATCIHVCCAPHAQQVVEQLVRLCGDGLRVERHRRLVPLKPQQGSFRVPGDVRQGDALIVFSRRAVHKVAGEVERGGLRASMIYGALPHDVRHEEARRFDAGETDVVVATDAIGMGMNLPIRRIVFVEQQKFDGHAMRPLRPDEVQQIAGRAGRFGRYDEGWYTSVEQRDHIRRRYRQEVPAITSIPVGIPHNIAYVRDATLLESLQQWAALEQPKPFERIGIERDLRLVREVEAQVDEAQLTSTNTKLLVLALASMPFDERDMRLLQTWRAMVRARMSSAEPDLPLPAPPAADAQLAQLEADYRYCDLLYTYERLFGDGSRQAQLVERRAAISRTIMAILAR